MSSGLQFDENLARQIEALYQTEGAARRRRAVLEAVQPRNGERVIDIGAGPGFVAYEMADLVGSEGEILGVDVSEPMLQLAERRCADERHVRFQTGDATQLPADDASFDVAVSVQVYEYVSDVDADLGGDPQVLRSATADGGPYGQSVVIAQVVDRPSR